MDTIKAEVKIPKGFRRVRKGKITSEHYIYSRSFQVFDRAFGERLGRDVDWFDLVIAKKG